jgi:hypothetical protein
MTTLLKDIIQPLVVIFGGIFALYQYQKQQKFKRLQNLSTLWKSFLGDEKMLDLFNLLNLAENFDPAVIEAIKNYDPKMKYRYLAVIEEVTLYADTFEVDKPQAKYLFQWHFYFAYQSPDSVEPFWDNLGGAEERNASYWAKSRNLAKEFLPFK